MPSLNKVLLMGNITRDPELKYLPSQTAVCDFGLAVNRTWTDNQGQKKEEVTFVDISAFGKVAETINQYLQKGSPIFIEGRLKLDQWEAQDGTKRSKMRVIADSFQFLPKAGPRDNDGGGEYQGEAHEQPQQRPQNRSQPPARAPQRPPQGNAGYGAPRGGPPASRGAAPAPAHAADPGHDPVDDAPPIKDDDIPF